ncbi:MAG: hypothetical protein R3E83_19375 [Burkholderiaceae bacterium]
MRRFWLRSKELEHGNEPSPLQQGIAVSSSSLLFGTEEQCERALMVVPPAQWLVTVVRCADAFYRLKRGSHGGFNVGASGTAVSVTAGTIMADNAAAVDDLFWHLPDQPSFLLGTASRSNSSANWA